MYGAECAVLAADLLQGARARASRGLPAQTRLHAGTARFWQPAAAAMQPVYRDFRAGDVRHSQADIGKATSVLGYVPTHRVAEGLDIAAPWYAQLFGAGAPA